MKTRFLIVIAAVLMAGAGVAYAHSIVLGYTQSPFPLWDYTPGRSFRSIDDQAHAEAGHRFACELLDRTTRLCTLRSRGIAGVTRMLVDSMGRSVVIQFLPDSETAVMRDEAQRTAARWNKVERGVEWRPDTTRGEHSATAWRTDDGRWSASMRYGRFPASPTQVTVTDEGGLEAVIANDPIRLLRLSALRLLDQVPDERRAAAVEEVFALRERELPERAARAAGLSRRASALPACGRQGAAFIERVDERFNARTYMGREAAGAIERAFPAVWPGRSLLFESEIYAVDGHGVAEEVRIAPHGSLLDGTRVFLVEFPQRQATAGFAAGDHIADGDCRAPATIVLVPHDSVRSAPIRSVDLDDEALATQVLAAEVTELPAAARTLTLRYRATYGTGEWQGEVEWLADVDLDSLRLERRVPMLAGRRDRDGRTIGVTLAPSTRGAGGRRYLGIPADRDAALPSFIVLPTGPRPSGWLLVDLL